MTGVGGERGWYVTPLLWSLRGGIDKLIGGVGMRRGRRHPDQLGVGDALDFWRVEAVEAPRLVRLRAEMRLPGDAWLEWHIEPVATGSRLTQRAIFYPRAHRARLLVRPAALPRTDLRPPRPPPGGGAVGDDRVSPLQNSGPEPRIAARDGASLGFPRGGEGGRT